MSKLFAVTYEIVTPESAECGDADKRGDIDTMTLRDAIQEVFRTRTNEVDGIECCECSQYPWPERSQWFTVINDREYCTGAQESRSLHRAHGVTNSSWGRILRLCGVIS